MRRLRLKCDGTRAGTRFCLSAKQTSPFKSAGESLQSITGSRVVRISGSNAGYTTFRGSVKRTGYPLHSPVSPSLPLLCVTVCHHTSTGLYQAYCPRAKQPEREADHSSTSGTDLRNERNFTLIPPCALFACRGTILSFAFLI